MAAEEDDAGSLQPPQHPVPQLQGPFEESMMESIIEADDGEQGADPVVRRRLLLQGDKYERVCAGRWKQRSGEKFHPLWKLSAQLSFGIHLLAKGLAKSEEEVMRILQSHVDDVDGFLERTSQDFDLAQSDVDDRLRYLRLPLEHVDVFDHMLEDRTFRTSIVDGNERIEHIVERTSEAMKDALKDVQKGIDATSALGKYLTQLKTSWKDRTPDLDAVYTAMQGNVEGWTRAFVDLHLQGNRLAVSLVQLAGIIAEMQRRAGIVSRRGLPTYNPATNGGHSPAQKSSPLEKRRTQSPPSSSAGSPQPSSTNAPPNKPLPRAPDTMNTARQASRAKLAHEEKLRSRSLEASREQQKTKDNVDHPERKASIADKVRSVTKLGAQHTIAAKPNPAKAPNAKSPVPEQVTSSTGGPPKVSDRSSSTRSTVLTKVKERSPRKVPESQPRGPVELPAEVPRGAAGKEESSKKGGLHIRLGSKHRDKEQGSGTSPSKPFYLFRRSPQPVPSGGVMITPQPAGSPTRLEDRSETSPAIPQAPSPDDQSSLQSAPLPQRQSPDPGLPTPPALVSDNGPRGGEPSTYTALPDVLATAQRIKPVKALLRLSVPTSTEPEAEKTPRGIPPRLSDPSEPRLMPAQSLSNESKAAASSENPTEPQPNGSSLEEAGPKGSLADGVEVSEAKPVTTSDGEKTPIASQPPIQMPAASSSASQHSSAEPNDTVLTSATMRSFSDFCKLPPQSPSPTPPPATPDESGLPPRLAHPFMTSASDARKTINDQENGPIPGKGEQSKEVPDAQLSPSRSPDPKPVSGQKTSSNAKGLSLHPKVKDSSNSAGIFDLIASTPPHSPIHTRAPSDVEASASGILGPPGQAPAPPAPGGRSMINPDFATAGALEGERKAKRSSTISSNGWKKKMFNANGNNGSTSDTASPVNGAGGKHLSGSEDEDEEIQMSANLMSGKGNDVLWYKGMGKDGLWVSGA